jgi:L-cysteine/cystine lyase
MSWETERARFPVLDRHAYLNAGTFGPLSRETLAAMAELRAYEGAHGRSGRTYFDAMLERRERVRGLLAAEIAVPPDHVALTESTTQGVQIAVLGLELGPGDEVVTTDAEHFGLIGPLAASGASLRFAPVRHARAADVFELVRAQVTPRTRLIALSAVSWLDGTIFPWRELREATGLPVLVDGAQSAGAVAVDAAAADFYTVSCQKWLCGPDSTGALSVADPEALRPRLVAYPSVASHDLATGAFEPKPGARRFDPAFGPASSLGGLEAALTDLPAGRFERALSLAARCRELLLERGLDVVTEAGQATLVSVRLAGDTAEAVARLAERDVVVRELPGTGLIRASVGWWNDESDLQRFADGVGG